MPYSPGMEKVTATGQTVRQRRGGVWVDVPVVMRNGRVCACGDLHGIFPRCIASDAQKRPPQRRKRARADHPAARTAQEFFPLPKRRLPRAIPQATIDGCPDCHPVHEAFYYCEAHRSQAVRNVLLAGRKSGGVISLHLMMADKGFDICS